jgi:putative ABC transport system ATP-binding protein
MSDDPLFELRGVSLAIDDVAILDDVSLVVPAAGITVVLGPSGAGKSMLLRLLNRLEVPTAGEVLFRGEPVAALDPLALRRRVGMVFQRPAPFPGTVRDNLLVADPGSSDHDLAAALRDARLDAAFLDRSADELSGGEAQRMCLARTLVTRPEALLMDEPTSALDPDARRGLERTAHRLATGGRPLVWVTHDLEQADRLADDVVVLIDGRLAGADDRARFLADEWGTDDEPEDEPADDPDREPGWGTDAEPDDEPDRESDVDAGIDGEPEDEPADEPDREPDGADPEGPARG